MKQGSLHQVPQVPPATKKKAQSKFRVPIHKPSQAKIDAVINYKRSKGLLGKPSTTTTNKTEEFTIGSSSSSSSSVSNNKNSGGGIIHAAPVTATNVASLVEVCNGLQREQDNLRRSNRLIRDEIASLNDVHYNLLWLLKKSRQYETHLAAMGPT